MDWKGRLKTQKPVEPARVLSFHAGDGHTLYYATEGSFFAKWLREQGYMEHEEKSEDETDR